MKEFKTGKETYKTRLHLMEFIKQEKALEKRETGWFTEREAMEKLDYQESKDFIESALERYKAQ